MTTPIDRAALHKLIADVLEHDRRATPGPMRAIGLAVAQIESPFAAVAQAYLHEDSQAIALCRTAAPQLATALRDALAEVVRLESEIDDLNARIGGLT